MKKQTNTIKQIVMKGNLATISHVVAGVIYYEVKTETATYQFPVDMNDKKDVGTATFSASMKAITLMRYIRKAVENGELVLF